MIDFDLHIHCAPYSSCATQSIEQAVDQAYEAGATTIAICNHNTIDGLDVAKKACMKKGMKLINGVELSVSICGVIIHLLGYNFQINKEFFEASMTEEKEKYIFRLLKICSYLRENGYNVNDCETHKDLRYQLMYKGYFENEKEAKKFLMSDKIKSCFPDEKMDSKKAINLIHSMKGKVYWAHPNTAEHHIHLQKEQIEKIIDILCAQGLDGLEVFHPNTFSEKGMVEYLLELAKTRNLMASLGSDTHHKLDKSTSGIYFICNKDLNAFNYDFNKIKYLWEEKI